MTIIARKERSARAPPDEPRRGALALRSFLAMIVIGGLLFAGIWFYVRGAESDLMKREQIFRSLRAIGGDIWETGGSAALMTESEDQQKDFEDLPRVIASVRAWTRARGTVPRIVPVEVDPLSSRANATHHIQYFFNDRPLLVIQVRYHPGAGTLQFIGVTNGVNVPSRPELQKSGAPENAAPPPQTAPPVPPPAVPVEKVSEPPAIPQ